MKNSYYNIYIIISFLFFGFTYISLRNVIFDHWGWVFLSPVFSIVFFFTQKLSKFLTTDLDKLMYYYAIFGVAVFFLNVSITLSFTEPMRILIHIYLPVFLYFISKSFCFFSHKNILRCINIIVFIAIFFIMDIFIEYYIIKNISPFSIPWVSAQLKRVAIYRFSIGTFYNTPEPLNAISLMGGGKNVALLISSLFVFLLPFVFFNSKKFLLNIFVKNKYLNFLILLALFSCSFLLPSFANTLSLIAVSIMIIFLINRNIKSIVYLSIFIALIFILKYDFLVYQYKLRMSTSIFEETEIAYIFSILPVIEYYLNSNVLAYLIGGVILPDALPILNTLSELTLLLMPLDYGIIWTMFILIGIMKILRYCYKLISLNKHGSFERLIGFSFLGFIFIYITNLHYPAFNMHGNYELFFFISGILSATYELNLHEYHNLKSNKREIF